MYYLKINGRRFRFRWFPFNFVKYLEDKNSRRDLFNYMACCDRLSTIYIHSVIPAISIAPLQVYFS